MHRQIAASSISAMLEREKALYIQRNPASKRLGQASEANWLRGVPMHWMVDWGTPFPLFVTTAQGVDVTDADVFVGTSAGSVVGAQITTGGGP